MVVTLCHSAMITVPPVFAAASALYEEPARSMPALGDADGAAALCDAAPDAGALADGEAVPPQAPANIATASMVKTRFRIKSPPPDIGTALGLRGREIPRSRRARSSG